MRINYSKWIDPPASGRMQMEQLVSLFSYLLMQTDGDVGEALQWMEFLDQEHQLFGRGMTMLDFIEELKRRGLIRPDEKESFEITPKGEQRIREDALNEIFSSLKRSPDGLHETPHMGTGVDRVPDTRKYAFGDTPTNIDLTSTLKNAYIRGGIDAFQLEEGDVEVYETEHQTSVATVVMLDISHSMILYGEDRITPAKQVALALSQLIMTRYPKDELRVLLFGDDAREVTVRDLPFVKVGPFHTNTREGLRLARSFLRRSANANKQIFMITDGKPSAMFEDNGRLYKNPLGLDPRIVNKTLDEAVACRRERIVISTFMVASDPALVRFVEELTRANRGRAYFTGLGKLGEFVLVDYIRNRRKSVR